MRNFKRFVYGYASVLLLSLATGCGPAANTNVVGQQSPASPPLFSCRADQMVEVKTPAVSPDGVPYTKVERQCPGDNN